MGMVGEDGYAEELRRILRQSGIDLDAIQIDGSFQTIVKTRIIARQQQLVRVDRKSRNLFQMSCKPAVSKKSAGFFRNSTELFSKITERDSFSNVSWMVSLR